MINSYKCIYCNKVCKESYCSEYCYNMSEFGNEEGILDKK